MSDFKWKFRVEEIRTSIESILSRIEGKTYSEFVADDVLKDSIGMRFVVLGEAASKVPEEVRARNSDIPWRMMIGMRNVMAHNYSTVKYEVVWETLRQDLPPLLPMLEKLLATEVE